MAINNPFTLKLLISGTILSIIIMAYTGRPIKQSNSEYKNIICLEFAHTASKVQSIINAWQLETINGKTILQHARINTYWDFMFIFFYSTSLFFAHRSMAKPAKRVGQIIFSLAGGIALIAGGLDIIENIGMLRSMDSWITDQNAFVTATCAKIKFILLVLSISLLFIRWIIARFTIRKVLN